MVGIGHHDNEACVMAREAHSVVCGEGCPIEQGRGDQGRPVLGQYGPEMDGLYGGTTPLSIPG